MVKWLKVLGYDTEGLRFKSPQASHQLKTPTVNPGVIGCFK